MEEPTAEEKFNFFHGGNKRLLKEGETSDLMQIITNKETGEVYRFSVEGDEKVKEWYANKILERMSEDIIKLLLSKYPTTPTHPPQTETE